MSVCVLAQFQLFKVCEAVVGPLTWAISSFRVHFHLGYTDMYMHMLERENPHEKGGWRTIAAGCTYRVYGIVCRGVPQGATSVCTLRAASPSYCGRPTSCLVGGLRARRSGVGAFQQ